MRVPANNRAYAVAVKKGFFSATVASVKLHATPLFWVVNSLLHPDAMGELGETSQS